MRSQSLVFLHSYSFPLSHHIRLIDSTIHLQTASFQLSMTCSNTQYEHTHQLLHSIARDLMQRDNFKVVRLGLDWLRFVRHSQLTSIISSVVDFRVVLILGFDTFQTKWELFQLQTTSFSLRGEHFWISSVSWKEGSSQSLNPFSHSSYSSFQTFVQTISKSSYHNFKDPWRPPLCRIQLRPWSLPVCTSP